MYDLANATIFKGKLPKCRVIWKIEPEFKECLGYTEFEVGTKRPLLLHLNPKHRYDGKIWVFTLLHEMVHIEQRNGSLRWPHGKKFVLRMRQLAAKGYLDDLF